MVVPPPLVATGDPPDPPIFGSFRSNNPQPFGDPKITELGKNPNSTSGSLSGKTVAPPSGPVHRQQSGPGPHKRSYSEVVKPAPSKSRSKQDLHLFGKVNPHPGVRSSLRDGVKVISINSAVNSVLSEPFRWAVVGKFSHGVPKLNQIGKFLASLNLDGKFDMHWLSPRQVMVILGEETDFVRVWLGKIWQVAGFPMRVSKWSPSFDSKVESPVVPVWVRLPGLPAHFFDRGVLFEIASNVGKPIRVDSATAFRYKLSEARFCVEMNLLLPRVDFLFLEFEGIMRKQRVVYENLPIFCSSCSHVGHGDDVCYRNNPESKPVVQDIVVKHLNDVDGCVDSGASSMAHLEMAKPAPSQKLQMSKRVFENVQRVFQSILPIVDSFGFLGFNLGFQGAVLLSQRKTLRTITEIEEGEILEDGNGCVNAKDGLHVDVGIGDAAMVEVQFSRDVSNMLMHAICDQSKEKIGEGQLFLDYEVMESVGGVVPEMIVSDFQNLALHAPVRGHTNPPVVGVQAADVDGYNGGVDFENLSCSGFEMACSVESELKLVGEQEVLPLHACTNVSLFSANSADNNIFVSGEVDIKEVEEGEIMELGVGCFAVGTPTAAVDGYKFGSFDSELKLVGEQAALVPLHDVCYESHVNNPCMQFAASMERDVSESTVVVHDLSMVGVVVGSDLGDVRVHSLDEPATVENIVRSDVTRTLEVEMDVMQAEKELRDGFLASAKQNAINFTDSANASLHGTVHELMQRELLGGSLLDGVPAAVVGGDEIVPSDVTAVSYVEVDVMTAGMKSLDRPDDSLGRGCGPDHQSVGPEPGRRSGPVGESSGPEVLSQQTGLQSNRPMGKIHESTKTLKPFRLFKDKRQSDRMDGIFKSGFLRKPVRNVHTTTLQSASADVKPPLQLSQEKSSGILRKPVRNVTSEGVKTPLELAQEELAKGGAFHDFVITDSHTSKPFSNMDFMARMSWADEMEDDVD